MSNPKKYNKFIATAATATLVASAVVPVASAASFSDVADSSSHAVAIDALVEAGIINGYQDGTFKPGTELNRGHVVKMLGKWVEQQGFAIPADWNKVQRFSDLPVDSNDKELVQYAALVKDAGVFVGSNGELNAKGKITRQNMALTLDRAFEAVTGTSLVEAAQGLDQLKVADLTSAKSEAREAIQALRNLGVTTETNFNPAGNVTRAQFASFLYRTINVDATDVELSVKEAVAVNANTLNVTLSDDSTHVVELDKALEANKKSEVTFTIDGVEYTATVTFEVTEPQVVSVNDINRTSVEVTFVATTADVYGATVEVKDSEGNVYNVKAVDISEGDTVATFKFEDAFDADFEFKGIWTVNGVKYNFDVLAQFDAIQHASNEVELLKALNNAGISNVKEELITNYKSALAGAEKLENLNDVQKVISDTNKEKLTASEAKKSLEEVAEASNQVALLKALDSNFERVNSDWITNYEVELDSNTALTSDITEANAVERFEAMQALIDGVNTLEVGTAVATAEMSVDAKKVAEARELVNSYAVPAEEEGELTDFDYASAVLDFEDSIIEVLDATTNSSLDKALVALDAKLVELQDKFGSYVPTNREVNNKFANGGESFDYDLVESNLLAKYRAALTETATENKNQARDIQTVITTVNNAEAVGLINAVIEAEDASELLDALNAYPGLKQVAETNEDFYFATSNANFSSVANTEAIQTAVDTANLAALKAATSKDVIEKLNVFGLNNVVSSNAAEYVGEFSDVVVGENNQATVESIKAVVKAVNDEVATEAAVEAVNEADTASQVKSALDKLADLGELSSYLNVTSEDRIFIAEQVLNARTDEFANADAINAEVVEATQTRTDAIQGVNELTISSSLTDVATALLSVGHPSLSGNESPTSNDTIIADEFIKSLTFNEDGEITKAFRSISDIRAAITSATK